MLTGNIFFVCFLLFVDQTVNMLRMLSAIAVYVSDFCQLSIIIYLAWITDVSLNAL